MRADLRTDRSFTGRGGRNLFTAEEKALIEQMVQDRRPYAEIYRQFPDRPQGGVLKWIMYYR